MNPEQKGKYDDPKEIQRDIQRTRTAMRATLDELQSRYSPHALIDRYWVQVRANSGELFRNLAGVVRDHPVPVVLVGTGLAWLAISDRNGHARLEGRVTTRELEPVGTIRTGTWTAESVEGELGSETRAAGEAVKDSARYVGERARDLASSTRELTARMSARKAQATTRIKSAAHDMAESAREVGHRMSEGAHVASEKVKQAGERVRDGLHNVAEGARSMADKARTQADHLRENATEYRDMANRKFREVSGAARRMPRENPLLFGLAGLAIGAAIGAILPHTRREDRLLGPQRDDLFETAKDRMAEKVEQGKRVIQATVEAASEAVSDVVDEAKLAARREGLTDLESHGEGSEAREELRETYERGKEKAFEAKEAAKETFRESKRAAEQTPGGFGDKAREALDTAKDVGEREVERRDLDPRRDQGGTTEGPAW